ncbi:hypothetical protein KP509_27G053300 [Ceratopteris richardii]|uniref:Exonuclease domain-containing protein n=1 Tax=Ceratopteris richardii TaxID=49495 RepID=A0A8T2RI65_CERRI|nr:hypothetical protein KP509_27G053300 [Ceratopteris richardii]KAH7295527.1 hypothetical protein KP509_27G053300 [Ceratopteris richardii]
MGGLSLQEFTENDHEVLVKIVKAAQRCDVKGSKGDWKRFLKKSSTSKVSADPAKRPWTTLAEFMVEKMRASDFRQKSLKDFESGGVWRDSPKQALVRATYMHRRFKEYYMFPSSDEGWVLTDSKKADDGDMNERMISLDCEMVDCDDNTKAIVRVCAVDAEYKVLLDMLVKPNRPVLDYLTSITGICEADLQNTTCSFLDAQAAVLNLLTCNTILVGHSLHNDLKALKIDHARLIDTSFLFQFRNKPESFNAGLNSLCKAVLGYTFRDDTKPHDCILDATIPMKIVHHVLMHGINGPLDIESKMIDEGQLCKLYFHGIPKVVSVNDLQKLIPQNCSCSLNEISWSGGKYGTTYGIFKSIDAANWTFTKFKGVLGEDSYGRPQKTIMVAIKSSRGKAKKVPVRVRKMISDDDAARSKCVLKAENTLTQTFEVNENDDSMCTNIVSTKKRKMTEDDQAAVNDALHSCCGHLQEIESLKEQLQAKNEEVRELQKIILDLTRQRP